MMRTVAKATLVLYPKAWRDRYGDEVADLIASRPARLRTVVDLLAGASDAWTHRRHIPGARPVRIPLAAVLSVAGTVLLLLWNPGVRDLASLNGAWAEAAGAGPLAGRLREMATTLFMAAGAMGVLSVVPLLLSAYGAMKRTAPDPLARLTAQRVILTALPLAVPVGLFGSALYGMTFAHLGYPVGPLGEAMTGGFMVPVIMALVLPLPTIASAAPSLVPHARSNGRTLAVAAIMNALAWLPVLALVVLGLPKASWPFVVAVAASALVSVWMAALVARSVLRRGRAAVGELSTA